MLQASNIIDINLQNPACKSDLCLLIGFDITKQ